ncbi:MAG: Calx-beta domain-containing protein, partial [Planctomycetota bacterium]
DATSGIDATTLTFEVIHYLDTWIPLYADLDAALMTPEAAREWTLDDGPGQYLVETMAAFCVEAISATGLGSQLSADGLLATFDVQPTEPLMEDSGPFDTWHMETVAGYHVIVFRASDNAGNATTLYVATKVDTTPPGSEPHSLHTPTYPGGVVYPTRDTVAASMGGIPLYREGYSYGRSDNFALGWYVPTVSESTSSVDYVAVDFAGNEGLVSEACSSSSQRDEILVLPDTLHATNRAFWETESYEFLTVSGDFSGSVNDYGFSTGLGDVFGYPGLHPEGVTAWQRGMQLSADHMHFAGLVGLVVGPAPYRFLDGDWGPGLSPPAVGNHQVGFDVVADALAMSERAGSPGHWAQFFYWDCWWRKDVEGTMESTAKACDEAGTPRGVNVLALASDAICAGETATLKIRGGFPKEPTELEVRIMPRRKEDGAGGGGTGTTVTIAAVLDAAEPDSAGEFVVMRTGDLADELDVDYEVDAGSTATSGTDYAALLGTVTIPAGEDSAKIPVMPIDDDEKEDTETVVVTLLAGPASYDIGSPGAATLRIFDNWVALARVVEENPFLATVYRTIEVELDVPDDALGLYDIKVTCKNAAGEGVDRYAMGNVLDVLKMDLAICNGQGSSTYVADADEVSVGAFTVANLNNTDADIGIDGSPIIDRDDSNVPNEEDLMRLILRRPEPDSVEGAVRIRIASGAAKIWWSSDKSAGPVAEADLLVPTASFTTDHDGDGKPDIEWWVEATDASSSLRDISLVYEFRASGTGQWVKGDEARATGVWAKLTDFKNKSNEELWEDAGDPLRGLGFIPELHGKFGFQSQATYPGICGIGVGFQFTVLPSGIGGEPGVVFDVTRQIESKDWVIEGGVVSEYVPPEWETFPGGDVPNDDLEYQAEAPDEDKTPENDHIYSIDMPGVYNIRSYDQIIRRLNFYEFVRVRLDGLPLYGEQGDSTDSSRCSDKARWHSFLWLEKPWLAGQYRRRAGKLNSSALGHLPIGAAPTP